MLHAVFDATRAAARAAYRWSAKIFKRSKPAIEAPAPTAQLVTPATNARSEPETKTSYVHVGDILEALPKCRHLMRHLKTADRDAYDFHKQFGARILSPESMLRHSVVNAGFVKALPMAGMVFFKYSLEDPDTVSPSFFHFTKIERRPDFIGIPGAPVALYRFATITIAEKVKAGMGRNLRRCDRHSWTAYSSALIALFVDGRVLMIPEQQRENFRLKTGHGWNRAYGGFCPYWELTAAERSKRDGRPISAQELVGTMIPVIFNAYDSNTEDFQVRAERNGVSCAFSVELGRTPAFFKNRDLEAAKDGKRKRIFHAVEAHTRALKSGRVVDVAPHYRGARRFTWNGEAITITAPENSTKRVGLTATEIKDGETVSGNFMEPLEAAGAIRDRLETMPARRAA